MDSTRFPSALLAMAFCALRMSSSAQTATCGEPLSKEDGELNAMIAGEGGHFYAAATKGKNAFIQERDGSGKLLRESPLEIELKEVDLWPIFLLRTSEGIGVVATGMDGKGSKQVSAVIPVEPGTLKAGKPELLLDGKPFAEKRMYELYPGGTVSANGQHAVIWRADCYSWYQDPRTYSLVTCDKAMHVVERREIDFPSGPGDRFEHVGIDDNGDVYVVAVHDKTPGSRKAQPIPSGKQSVFEVWLFKPGSETPVKTVLSLGGKPIGDLAFIFEGSGALQCFGVLDEGVGGAAFTCRLDKAGLASSKETMSGWVETPFTVVAPAGKSSEGRDNEMMWQAPVKLKDGSWLVVGRPEEEFIFQGENIMNHLDRDIVVLRIAAGGGALTATRLPAEHQSENMGENVSAALVVEGAGGVDVLIGAREVDFADATTAPKNYNLMTQNGVLAVWSVAADGSASRRRLETAVDKKGRPAPFMAVTLSDGTVILPHVGFSSHRLPVAQQLCTLHW